MFAFVPDAYDPNKAKQLLQDAGYPGKFNPQTITLYTTAVAADLMQVLQGYWQAVGVNVDIQVVDTPVYNGLVFVRAKDPTEKQVGAVWPWVNVGALNNACAIGFASSSVVAEPAPSRQSDPARDA